MTLGKPGIEVPAKGVRGGEIHFNCEHQKSLLGRGRMSSKLESLLLDSRWGFWIVLDAHVPL